MTYFRKLADRPAFLGIEFDLYSLDSVLWLTAEHVSQALKRDHRALVRALPAPMSPWEARRELLPVWNYRYHMEVNHVRTLYSVDGALRLCVASSPDERASDFAAWLRRLKGSIHE